MKISPLSKIAAFGALSLVGLGLAAFSQPGHGGPRPHHKRGHKPLKPKRTSLRGSVYFLERIALPPDAQLHVSLVGRVAGAEYLPLATGIFPARNGETHFDLPVPERMVPPGPYRVQSWIIADNRVSMVGAQSQTTIASLDETPNIRLRMAGAPQNIDGIGDGKPLIKIPVAESPMPELAQLKGTATKLDRRALLPDATLKVIIEDQSRDDAKAIEIASRTIALEGKQVPVDFQLPVNLTRIKPGMRVGLRVQIFEGEKLRYASVDSIPVTRENIGQPFEVTLMNVVTHR